MDTNRSDRVRPSRTISPAFRSGPRQKYHDSSTDEIIRFVREYQRPDIQAQNQGSTGLKRKAVLPAIGGYSSSSDVIKYCHSVEKSHNELASGPYSNSLHTTRLSHTSTNASTADSGFVDKTSEFPDSNSEDNEVYNHDRNEFLYTVSNEDNDLDAEILSAETKSDPFRYKAGVMDIRKESSVDMADMRPVDRHSLVAEDLLVSQRSRRPSKILDNLLPDSSNSYLSKPVVTSRRFSNGAPRHAQLLRPRALPQLPPITRSEIPDRPSAPSPSLTPPSPRSDVGSADDEDEDHDCMNDFVNDNVDIDTRDSVDYIDCR